MTLMNDPYLNPPVDKRLYLSEAEAVTADGKSETVLDFKAAGCFPLKAFLVIEPFTLATGKTLTITPQSDSTADLATAPSTVGQALSFTAGTSTRRVIPISSTEATGRYFGLDYNVNTGAAPNITAYLTTAP